MRERVWPSTAQVFWLILGLGLLLRLWGAWRANLTYDEAAHLVWAQQISFRSDRFSLIFRSDGHPLLNAYMIKLSSLLFGFSFFGLRIVHVIMGTATIWIAYALGRKVYSESTGLWAAALMATDQFHASWSRAFLQETPLLFWFGLALLSFINVMERRHTRDFVLLGVSMAMAYLAKETGVLLIAVMWIFLFVTPDYRPILRDRRWYLAYLIALVIVLPDLLYNLLHFSDSYFKRDAHHLSQPFGIQFKPASLYLGELFRVFIDRNLFEEEYDVGNLYLMHWPAGVLYLLSTAAAFRSWRVPRVRLLLILFGVVMGFFALLPGGQRFDPFWWASPSIFAAVVFAGWTLDRLAARHQALRVAAAVLVGYLGVHFAVAALEPGRERQPIAANSPSILPDS